MDKPRLSSTPRTGQGQPRWQKLARLTWFVVAVMNGVVIVTTLIKLYGEVKSGCDAPHCIDELTTMLPAVAYLEAAGVSLIHFTLTVMTISFISAIVFCGTALLIFLRSSDRIAFLISLTLLLMGGQSFSIEREGTFWFLLMGTHNYLLFVTLILSFYLFPNGRFVPKWLLWVAVALFITEFFYSYFPDAHFSPHNFWPPLETAVWFGALVLIPAAQIYRFFIMSTATERQQTKWVVAGLLVVLVGILLLAALLSRLPPALQPAGQLATYPLLSLILLVIPLSLAMAILRYRLWDIDVIIRKTLVYSLLSALLVLVYIGMVLLLQSVFESVSGQRSPIVIVISTLAIAALFSPLRQRIQAFIDRRFYRKKYDAQMVLARFAQTTRNEVSLEALTAELTCVVQETMLPEYTEIWLRNRKQ